MPVPAQTRHCASQTPELVPASTSPDSPPLSSIHAPLTPPHAHSDTHTRTRTRGHAHTHSRFPCHSRLPLKKQPGSPCTPALNTQAPAALGTRLTGTRGASAVAETSRSPPSVSGTALPPSSLHLLLHQTRPVRLALSLLCARLCHLLRGPQNTRGGPVCGGFIGAQSCGGRRGRRTAEPAGVKEAETARCPAAPGRAARPFPVRMLPPAWLGPNPELPQDLRKCPSWSPAGQEAKRAT